MHCQFQASSSVACAGGTLVGPNSVFQKDDVGFRERFIKGDVRENDECLTNVKLENIPSLVEIDRSHCLLSWPDGDGGRSYGTGFVGSIKDEKTVTRWIISAGHNFKGLDKNVLKAIEKCEIFFGNTHGFLTKTELDKADPTMTGNTKHVLLKDIVDNQLQPTHVWCYDKGGEIAGQDYAAFLLSETKVTEHHLNLHSLLLCEQIIDYKGGKEEGTVVVIFGHPKSKDDWYRDGKGRLELKFSAGKLVKLQSPLVEEEELGELNEANHRVFYTNSTNTGSSGSPVLGPVGNKMATTKYRVLAIHSGGRNSKQKEKRFNYGHDMASIVTHMKHTLREARNNQPMEAEEQEHKEQ